MYAAQAEIGGERLNFAVSGMLWRRSLVMRDEETGTLWSHLLGKGMRGKHAGVELEVLPSELTDWKTWKRDHPNTDVLAMRRTAREFVTDFQKAPGRFVFGVREGDAVVAYPYDVLKREVVVNDEVGGETLVVTFEEAAATARVFYRQRSTARAFSAPVYEAVGTFEAAGPGVMKDAETGSLWDTATGVCREGELKGSQLKAAGGIPSFKKAWAVFYPEGEVYLGDKVTR